MRLQRIEAILRNQQSSNLSGAAIENWNEWSIEAKIMWCLNKLEPDTTYQY